MFFGIHVFPTTYSIQPGELALQAEDRGFDSVWFSEHTHILVDFLKSNPAGQNLADHYWQLYDPFIALALASASKSKIKIGTGICLVIEHDPVILAKSVATIDQVSSGRFLFGIGAGWIGDEMETHGVNYRTRYRLLDEQLQAMKNIWENEDAAFSGKYVHFPPIKSFPKPYQVPYPPIIFGGAAGPKTLNLVVEHCTGWMPLLGYPNWTEIKLGIVDLHNRCLEIDRDPASIEVTIFSWEVPTEEFMSEMESAGVRRFILSLDAKTREDVLPILDEVAKLVT